MSTLSASPLVAPLLRRINARSATVGWRTMNVSPSISTVSSLRLLEPSVLARSLSLKLCSLADIKKNLLCGSVALAGFQLGGSQVPAKRLASAVAIEGQSDFLRFERGDIARTVSSLNKHEAAETDSPTTRGHFRGHDLAVAGCFKEVPRHVVPTTDGKRNVMQARNAAAVASAFCMLEIRIVQHVNRLVERVRIRTSHRQHGQVLSADRNRASRRIAARK